MNPSHLLEAKMCAPTEVALVGGGNSAGQAAVFLAQQAARVLMLVRGPSLAASMSRYLIDSHGFVLTGMATARGADMRLPAPLESNVPGVFGVGDVRSGSVKRVGGAIGAAVAQIHKALAAARAAR